MDLRMVGQAHGIMQTRELFRLPARPRSHKSSSESLATLQAARGLPTGTQCTQVYQDILSFGGARTMERRQEKIRKLLHLVEEASARSLLLPTALRL
jgi:hypothetical protein